MREDTKDMALADAVEQYFVAEKKIIKLRKVVFLLLCVCAVLATYFFCNVAVNL